MPVVRWRGSAPASILEGSGPGDWIANLGLEGDLARLVGVETAGPMAAYFAATWNANLKTVALRPAARLDFEGMSAAGALPQAEIAFAWVFDDGTRQVDATPLRIAVLDRDDTAPIALAFANGGTVAAGELGAAIGRLAVADPDTAGPFHFTFSTEDEWRFEVVDGVLKLRDGITLGWDDVGTRPVVIAVSDGLRSAAFVLDITVLEPLSQPEPPPPPVLAPGETEGGFTLTGRGEALTTRPAEDASGLTAHPGGVQQVVLDGGEDVWLAPVARIRFADGWLASAEAGPAAEAAALHRAVLGTDADGIALAPLVAALQAGAGWAEVAADLLLAAPALAGLGHADFVHTVTVKATGAGPDAAALALHTARLEGGGTAMRAQVLADIALSPAAMARLAEAAPEAGLWVADAFDDLAGLPARPTFAADAPAAIPAPADGAAWFM